MACEMLTGCAGWLSLKAMKRQLWADMLGDLDTSARESMDQMVRMMKEPDFAEGVAAFQARRPPSFLPPIYD